MIANPAVDFLAKLLVLALVLQNARAFGNDAEIAAKHEGENFGGPLLAKGFRKINKDALLFCSGNFCEDFGEAALFVVDKLCDGV